MKDRIDYVETTCSRAPVKEFVRESTPPYLFVCRRRNVRVTV